MNSLSHICAKSAARRAIGALLVGLMALVSPVYLRAQEAPAGVIGSSSIEQEAENMFESGERKSRQWDYAAGFAVFEQVAAKYPGTYACAKAQRCIGQYLKVGKRRYLQSIKHYDKAIEMAPNTEIAALARFDKAHALYMRGFYEEAVREFEAVIASGPPVDILKMSVSWSALARSHRNAERGGGKKAAVTFNGDPACGPLSLLALCKANGVKTDLKRLKKLTNRGEKGTNLARLVSAANSLGLRARPVSLTIDGLRKAPLPCMVWILEGHFVIVSKISDRRIVLKDSAEGTVRMTLVDFAAIWGGETLVVDNGKPASRVVAQAPELSPEELRNAWGGCCGVSGTPGTGGPPDQPKDKPPGDCALGDPVNMYNGNDLLHPWPDLSWSNCVGPPVIFRRAYNTQLAYNGHFGYGWTNTLDIHLKEDASQNVELMRGDGRRDVFTWAGGGDYLAQDGIHDTLRKVGADYVLTLKDARETLTFNSYGRIVSWEDGNGNALTFAYQTIGSPGDPEFTQLLNTVTDQSGGVTRLIYGAGNLCESIADPSGRTVRFTYSGGDLASARLPDDTIYSYAYDGRHYITDITTPSGVWQYGYDWFRPITGTAGRISGITDPNGRGSSYWYEYYSNWSRATNARGAITKYWYDDDGKWTQTTDALGGVSRIHYDSDLNVDSVTNENNLTTSYTYDSTGNMLSVTEPTGNMLSVTEPTGATWRYGYSPSGDLLELVTDPLGRETHYGYDGAGNLISIQVEATGATWSYTYLPGGLLSTITDPSGGTTTLGPYNAYGKPLEIRDATGAVTTLTYDSGGNVASIADPNGGATSFTYDLRDRLTDILYPDGSTKHYEYNCCGLKSVTDEKNRTTQYEYDKVGNLTKVTDPAGYVTDYEYDGVYNLTRITDAKDHASDFEYDALNRLIGVTGAYTETYNYDKAGNLVKKTDGRGVETRYAYDANARLTGISTSAGDFWASYSYDVVGNLRRMRDPTGTSAFSYDAGDRLVIYRAPTGESVSYTWDTAGHKTSIATPYGSTRYAYDVGGRLARIDSPIGLFSYRYDPAGLLAEMAGPAHSALYRYDSRNRLVSVRNLRLDGTPITTHDYALDPAGNPVRVVEYDGSAASRTFYQYDALDRLVGETRTGGAAPYSYAYVYDPVGNRLEKRDLNSAVVTAYTYADDATNKMLTAAGAAYEYDANGNTTRKTDGASVTAYQWDSRDKLVSVDLPGGGTTIRYTYDALAHRVLEQGAAGARGFLYDARSDIPTVLGITGFDGSVSYVASPQGWLLGEVGVADLKSYVCNGQGTIVTEVNAAGVSSAPKWYDAWGVDLGGNGGSARGYVGEYGYWTDSNSRVALLGARWYDYSVGRFLSRDPLGTQESHPYSYVENRPTFGTDPHGLFMFPPPPPPPLLPLIRPPSIGPPPIRLPGKNKEGSPNGCGPHGFGALVPDFDFTGCCNHHDTCYENNYRTGDAKCRKQCDDALRDCIRKKAGSWHKVPGDVYWWFTRAGGGFWWNYWKPWRR
ncbi:MAG: cysteine peptidase family C39 domain-containing protein [Armatimonadota bacterium]|nr:cysteine peptidase family C39 domain-containing protein [Armatimonadota bacterium]